jgi:hypothetical protein
LYRQGSSVQAVRPIRGSGVGVTPTLYFAPPERRATDSTYGCVGRSRQVRKIWHPTGIRSPDCPAHSQSLYCLNYPALTPCIVLHKSKMGFLKLQLYEQNINYSYSFHSILNSNHNFFSTSSVCMYILQHKVSHFCENDSSAVLLRGFSSCKIQFLLWISGIKCEHAYSSFLLGHHL